LEATLPSRLTEHARKGDFSGESLTGREGEKEDLEEGETVSLSTKEEVR